VIENIWRNGEQFMYL